MVDGIYYYDEQIKTRFETFKQQRFGQYSSSMIHTMTSCIDCLSSRQRFQQLPEVNSGDFSGCIPDWINTVCWPPLGNITSGS